MCGRFLLTADPRELADHFGLDTVPALAPRYNVAPGQNVPVVIRDGEVHRLRTMRWGLVPSWATDPAVGFRMLNARCETVAEKPVYRAAFRQRRALVPATGFYEWRAEGRKKQPVLFRPFAGLFAFAGLWETWRGGDGTALETCTILTTAANDLVRPAHDRMPVIVAPADFGAWLDPSAAKGEAWERLFRPYPAAGMTAAEANPWVNDARHEGPRCLETVAVEPTLFVTLDRGTSDR